MGALLSLSNIEVVYNQAILALKSVSLEVATGSVVCLLGANGAGKTTTLKACSQLLAAERGMVSKGRIMLDGCETSGLGPDELVRRGVVQVLEGARCFAHLSVAENLLTGSFQRRGVGRAEIRRDLENIYELFPRLREKRKSLAGLLSGGERQMTAIGRALMARPRLVLLDEPSTGLAPQFVEELFEIVRQLNREQNVSFLVSEQNAALALSYANQAYILEDGRVMMQGEAAAMLGSPEVQALYMGGRRDGGFRHAKRRSVHRRPVFS